MEKQPSNVYRDANELLARVKAQCQTAARVLITIDGFDGSGKSTLGDQLSVALEAPRFDLDDFLNHHQGGVLEHLRYDCLKKQIEQATRDSGIVIVSGVCVLQALENIGIASDVRVYVKRMTRHPQPPGELWKWNDSNRVCEQSEDVEEFIQQEAEKNQYFNRHQHGLEESSEEEGWALEKELIRYHDAHRPHESADYILERDGGS